MSGRLPVRTILFAAVALALGGGTLLLGQEMLQTRNSEAARQANHSVVAASSSQILVATRTLAVGTSIKPADLAWRDWPTMAIDPSYIVRPSHSIVSFTGSVARGEIVSGEPITNGRLAVAGAGSALAAVTSPGRRAVSIGLTPTSGVSGLIVPGDRVDVVLTYALPRPADGSGNTIERRAATTILSDLRVLAIDQRLSGQATDVKEAHNASLEVTAKQSEMLALAADLGKLSLSLRSFELPAADRVTSEGSSTLDYQVGRLLPGFGPQGSRQVSSRTARRTGAPALTEFHGSKPNAAGPSQ